MAFGQTTKETIKERKLISRQSRSELTARATKEARKQAKALAKEGWTVAPGQLPLEKQLDKAFNMKYEYEENGLPPSFVDELYLTCNENIEHNQIYIIFSPNKFTKVNDVSGVSDSSSEVVLPRHLDNKGFHKWLTSCRKRDNEMRVDKRFITIRR